MGFEEDDLDTDLTKALQSTEVLHISTPCTSAAHKGIISGESCTHTGRFPSDLNLNISSVTTGNTVGQATPLRRVRTLSRSCCSVLDSPDIRQVFTFETWDQIGKTFHSTEPSDGFIDTFMDLLLCLNTCPSGTPITVEWNKNLPCCVFTCDIQGFKVFTDFAERPSIHLWLSDRFANIIPALPRSQKHD